MCGDPSSDTKVYDEHETFVARLDLAYPDRLVGVELDGRRHIEDTAFERDPRRRNRLTALGWTIYHCTWR